MKIKPTIVGYVESMMNAQARFTTKTRLKTVPARSDVMGVDFAMAREAKSKADLAWQVNFALLKLRSLKSEDVQARESFSTFHATARKSLWHARRA